MNWDRPPSAVERRDEGLALVDALLESSRPINTFPEAVHARVKRRLMASASLHVPHPLRRLHPIVIGGAILVCCVAFGVVLDRLFLKQRPNGSSEEFSAPKSLFQPARVIQSPSNESPLEMAAIPSVSAVESTPSDVVVAPTPSARAPIKRLSLRAGARAIHTPNSAELTTFPEERPSAPLPSVPSNSAPTDSALPLAKVPPPPIDELSEERLLANAVKALRSQGDAHSALVALEEYRMRFPEGRLWIEASILRADTMLALKRPYEALRVLDRLDDFSRMPGGPGRQLQRGELRASVGRWREAELDFTWAFTHALDQDMAERSLWGRAQCRVHVGDHDGAQSDAVEYLRRFPTGRFAGDAARLQRAGEP